ncbi:MAG TPA: phage recombination protein Bet [Anaerolineae bacterium]
MASSERSLLAKVAARYCVDPAKMLATLKATAFRGEVTNEQMMALLIVADQYKLNPFTKEIYAFPDKNNGIVPVVGVDGWARIINENPQFDGLDFLQDEESCTCTIYRKDRGHPVAVTEHMSECKRNTSSWGTHPRRMLRHKAMIQCARLAFGFAGIYDQDEAERILEARDTAVDSEPALPLKARLRAKTADSGGQDDYEDAGQPTTEAAGAAERDLLGDESGPVTITILLARIDAAKDADELNLCRDLIRELKSKKEQEVAVKAVAAKAAGGV